ncbi:hypothetical protein IG631_22546 [Alternaria alternata]|nr:hypothetical protein IG631_22546 [Alternaria alternata]
MHSCILRRISQAIMKLANLLTTTLSLFAASQPLASSKPESSDIWIGLDLKQCLTNASAIPPPKYVLTTGTHPAAPTPSLPDSSHNLTTPLTSTVCWLSRTQLGQS